MRQRACLMRHTARSMGCLMAVQLLLLLPGLALAMSTAEQQQYTSPVLAELPVTETGHKYHACLMELAEMFDSSNSGSRSSNPDEGPLAPQLSNKVALQISQQVVARLSDTLVDQFCEAVHEPDMRENLSKRDSRPETAATRKNNPSSNSDNRPASGRAAARMKALSTGQPRQPTRPRAAVAAAGAPLKRPLASILQVNTTPGLGYESVVPLTEIEYPESGLAEPEEAEYWNGKTERTDPTANLAFLSTCVVIDVANLVTETICATLSITGTWTGVGGGVWTAPIKKVCLAGLTAVQAAYETCARPLEYHEFYDGSVNDAELEATYINVMATMDNQVLLWDKIDITHTKLATQMTSFKQSMGNWIQTISTENCDLKTRVADAQREVNYLRYLLLTEEEKRPPFSSSAFLCSLSEPGYCSRPATNPVQAQVSSKQQVQAACSVTDGVKNIDLTTEARGIAE